MSIRLRELFACTEQGGAFVAESADGRLLHIGEVPSGLACNCVCPNVADRRGYGQTYAGGIADT